MSFKLVTLLALALSSASAFAPAQQRGNVARARTSASWVPHSGMPLSGNRRRRGPVPVSMVAAPEELTVASFSALNEYVEQQGGERVIRKILIANNGMAATKSILSMRNWAYMTFGDANALEFVAMCSPEDLNANAEYIKLADSYVVVPGGSNKNNYANVDLIIKIAMDEGVDGVWPGWGHASENPKLPDGLAAKGIKFIGPNSNVMAALGDKIAANILAQTAGVPSIPWSGDGVTISEEQARTGEIPAEKFRDCQVTTLEEAVAAAAKIGYPVMLKASEGGGGKGIRMNANEDELTAHFPQVVAEVPGSPMFMMQLATGARHLEVQVVGDEHGNAVALSGRDCSTQRRFQKIFEEAPPAIADPKVFREMEQAAMRLCSAIGYNGAGTVEYLYKADTDEFYFLELNPRLQVEHPCTEGVTGANMPSVQLQVAMGIPLSNIPDIRRFYGKDPLQVGDPIDFIEESYPPVTNHIVAARITAENPDEGFKPTSGKIDRVSFQSTPDVWGYFSIGANGGIHEFADSQFGHLFASGPNRETARRNLVMALSNLEVRGEIRTAVDYLGELLETQAFKDNTIDTAWLDGIIASKSVKVDVPVADVVVAAATYRAFARVKEELAALEVTLAKGQTGLQGLQDLNQFSIEITHLDVKYNFKVTRLGRYGFELAIGSDQRILSEVREQPDGSLLATIAGRTRKLFGQEEPLGIRVSIDGTTVFIPSVSDPTELRTDVTGKVVRYLQPDGAAVKKGTPYVEVEAMKMIMPLKATEDGKVQGALSPGSIISAGDLLATVELDDPSKVKKIDSFSGTLTLEQTEEDAPWSAARALGAVLDGYGGGGGDARRKTDKVKKGRVAALVADLSIEDGAAAIEELLQRFLAVETLFSGVDADAAVLALINANKDTPELVVDAVLAHQRLDRRAATVCSLLTELELLVSRASEQAFALSDSLKDTLRGLSELEGRACGEVAFKAGGLLRELGAPAFETRAAALREELKAAAAKGEGIDELAGSASLSTGVDLLTYLFSDDDVAVRNAALECYVRRLYRANTIIDIDVSELDDGLVACSFTFRFSDTPEAAAVLRKGLMVLLPGDPSDAPALTAQLPGAIAKLATDAAGGEKYDSPVNVLHFAYGSNSITEAFDGDDFADKTGVALAAVKKSLVDADVRTVNFALPVPPRLPRYFTFLHDEGYVEDPLRRDMRPSFVHLLELGRLRDNFELSRLESVGKNVKTFLGSEIVKTARRGASPQVVFVRAISFSAEIATKSGAESALRSALGELERTFLLPGVSPTASSRIFLNLMPQYDISPSDAANSFYSIMETLLPQYATRLVALRVDEIEVKLRCKGDDGETQPVRLTASSMSGEWLRTSAFLEYPDPITGVTERFCSLDGADPDSVGECFLSPYPSSSGVQLKRAAARRAGSTYAYDFLGLLEVQLLRDWATHIDANGGALPEGKIFSSEELIVVPGTEGEGTTQLAPSDRTVGTNDIGMVAWRATLRTPEYPDGREIVLIANDVTVQAGSFGVAEDHFYHAATRYARERALPRLYIACNSGARIGLVEALKPLFKVDWKDEANPTAGFNGLYLDEADAAPLVASGVVQGESATLGGKPVLKLTDIIGEADMPGIGVENLRGSGLIAGETSRAYNDVFTLSFVTGRSVGIGAYLNRLGQRVIQKGSASGEGEGGPMILTGFQALNKLLGRDVYVSQDQLGGPAIMGPNGVSHEIVSSDQAGVASMLRWLSYTPKTANDQVVAAADIADPVSRDVEWTPPKTPYDPRDMLAGAVGPDGKWQRGFFDDGSFSEYLAGWGKSVVVGRAKLGGIPMGVIAVETRLSEQRIPADPANPDSREALLPQAGQVWFPDSAHKTAQAIKDFNNGENLPLIIFANWRGFSGGTRDMYGEILKFGAMIVDALVDYAQPAFVYIPPNGELRGGAWVVIDPTINPEQMEMYADVDARGGILEPPGICEVKFRAPDQLKTMHRLDPVLLQLDSEIDNPDANPGGGEAADEIAAREKDLAPLYTQVAHEFADLHDRSGRMKAKGVIRQALEWPRAREFFYHRVKRRVAENDLVASMRVADPALTAESAKAAVADLIGAVEGDDDQKVLAALDALDTDAAIAATKKAALEAQLAAIKAEIEAL